MPEIPEVSKAELLRRMKGYGSAPEGRANFEADRAILDNILTEELREELGTLSIELCETRTAMLSASKESSKHSAALVKATRALVFLTAVYAIATIAMTIRMFR